MIEIKTFLNYSSVETNGVIWCTFTASRVITLCVLSMRTASRVYCISHILDITQPHAVGV